MGNSIIDNVYEVLKTVVNKMAVFSTWNFKILIDRFHFEVLTLVLNMHLTGKWCEPYVRLGFRVVI